MFFKKRGKDVRKCPRGHILDPDWDTCPYCAAQDGEDSAFLDESQAGPAAPTPDPPPTSPPPPSPPPVGPPSPPPSAAPPPPPPPRPTPSPPPPPAVDHSDPDLTQLSAASHAGARPSDKPAPPPPPPADDGSGPPPLVEWTDPHGRAAAPPPTGAPHQGPAVPPPSPAPPPPPPPPAPRTDAPAESLDEPTRILGAAPVAGLTVAWLIVAAGPYKGQDFRIPPGGARLGRLDTCAVCVPGGRDSGVSKEHAEVRMAAGQCVIVDLGSANGTFVNDERVTERVLQDGDRVRLGLVDLVFKSLVL